MPVCVHQPHRQFSVIFSCKNTPTTFTLTNKTYSGKKPLTAPQGGSWVVIEVSSVNHDIPNPGSYSK
jgi:hypothetical protein